MRGLRDRRPFDPSDCRGAERPLTLRVRAPVARREESPRTVRVLRPRHRVRALRSAHLLRLGAGPYGIRRSRA
eukprot:355489-Chlamydomonas_euryale.AAC.18